MTDVYFAKVGRYVKVGSSKDPAARVKRIRTDDCAKPDDLDRSAPVELLHVVSDVPPGIEWHAHWSLECFRVVGEWFVDGHPLRTFIASGHLEHRVAQIREVERANERLARRLRRRRRRT